MLELKPPNRPTYRKFGSTFGKLCVLSAALTTNSWHTTLCTTVLYLCDRRPVCSHALGFFADVRVPITTIMCFDSSRAVFHQHRRIHTRLGLTYENWNWNGPSHMALSLEGCILIHPDLTFLQRKTTAPLLINSRGYGRVGGTSQSCVLMNTVECSGLHL